MTHIRISGTGSALPPRIVSNHDLEQRVNTSDAWIRERTGIEQRHVADEGIMTSDLATQAARAALDAAGIAASDVDLLIVATTTPDMVFPSTACIVQAKLGIGGCIAFDIQAVCTGFLYGLATAERFMRAGGVRHALVIGAETFTRLLDWNDRGTCVLFGDGAGAVVLSLADQPGLLSSHLHADGHHVGMLCVPGHVDGGRIQPSPFVHMDGQAVFKFAVRVLDEVCREALAANDCSIDAVDWLIPHQANTRILSSTARRLGIDEQRVVVTVPKHGNTSAASVPLALDTAVRDGRVQRGQLLLLTAVGGGFTWGSALLRF
ncbi:MAG: ketoacyl-ACP synthase III [Pseudomonadota bacterium]|nr:ketoacyl-ACP synthase III [Pseudomonadota bacterium]